VIQMRCVILFCDVHEFSIASVALGDRLPGFIQDFYQTAGERIVSAHGTIMKYMGDMIFALFADKAELPAVRCALEMRSDFAALASRWKLPAPTELEVGIGSGAVARGTFGHPSHLEEDAFGEAVNVVASICHHRGVAITESVREKLAGAFPLTRLPPRKLKWRNDPVELWAVSEAAPSPGWAPRSTPAGSR